MAGNKSEGLCVEYWGRTIIAHGDLRRREREYLGVISEFKIC